MRRLACLLLALLVIALAAAPGAPLAPREVAAQAGPPSSLFSGRWISYTPTHYNPNTDEFPNRGHIRADLEALQAVGFTGVITPGAERQLGSRIPEQAADLGMSVIVGVANPANADEVDRAATVAGRYVSVVGYVCGSGGLQSGRYTLADVQNCLATLHAQTGRPVTTAEPSSAYVAGAPLLALGDWLFPAAHPYRALRDCAPQPAVTWTQSEYARLDGLTNLTVVLQQVGLPSSSVAVATCDQANQAAYYQLMMATDVPFVFYEAFDRFWNTNEPDGVGPHWGLLRCDALDCLPLGKAVMRSLFTLTAGRYDTTFPALAYDSGWDAQARADASDGVAVRGRGAATMSFDFIGNLLALDRRTGPNEGAMTVCVDGLCSRIDNTWSDNEWSRSVTLGPFPTGAHTVTITHPAEEARVWLDTIRVVELADQVAPLPAGQVIHDDHAGLFYMGRWRNRAQFGAVAGEAAKATRPYAGVYFHFSGDTFTLYRRVGPNEGSMTVCIDGACFAQDNTYAMKLWGQAVTFSGLGAGPHLVGVYRSPGSKLWLDGVWIGPGAPPTPLAAAPGTGLIILDAQGTPVE